MVLKRDPVCAPVEISTADAADLRNLSRDQLRACVEVGKAITAELVPSRLIPTIMEKVSKLLPAETWSLFLLDEATQSLRFEICMNIDPAIVKGIRLALGQGVAGRAAQYQCLLVVADVSQCSYFFNKVDCTTGCRTEALICVPILFAGRTLGVLELVNPTRMDLPVLSLLTLLADYLAIAIENTRRYQLMEERAVRDNLTGLYNQRYLYANLQRELALCGRNQTPLALVFMDMDDFKQLVDRLGHLNGSRALNEVAQRLNAWLSEPAFGVAYGGDEFVLVLPGFDREHAIELAAQIRRSVKAAPYLTQWGHHEMLTASFGVAVFPEDAADLTELLALADQAMFTVKNTGKDEIRTTVPRQLSRTA